MQKIMFERLSASQPAKDAAIKRLVMIVDDSATVRKIVEVSLSREGYEVVSAPDGVEALRYLLAPQTRLPDLILLDIEMPRMDGYQLAMNIRKRPHLVRIPLVILSRRAGVIDKLKARLAGVRSYLTKPFTEQDLGALVADFIGSQEDKKNLMCQPGPISAG
jgi:twitching motility two-component system response regulator PilG